MRIDTVEYRRQWIVEVTFPTPHRNGRTMMSSPAVSLIASALEDVWPIGSNALSTRIRQ
jgi:hypothetical protein